MRVRPLAATALVVAVLVGCSGDGVVADEDPSTPAPSAEPSADAAPEPSPSPAPIEVDPTVVPPVEQMTTAYVEAVVNTIEARSGELFAQVLAEPVNPIGALPDGVFDGLEALFAGDRLDIKIEEAEALAASDAARELVLPAEQYTGVRYEILQVSYAEPTCLIAVGRINRDGTSPSGGAEATLSVLSLITSSEREMNPTSWRIAESLINEDDEGIANPDEFALDATLADFDPVLAHDCQEGESSRVAP